jgi:uncharacterized repeat protein (TIGR03803 family)
MSSRSFACGGSSTRLFLIAGILAALLGTVRPAEAQSITTLYSFANSPDGSNPYASLALDAQGNLYGTTRNGGAFGYGAIFEVTPSGEETTLYSFSDGADGAYPDSDVLIDPQGNFYVTSPYGGTYGRGTAFELTSEGPKVLYSFGIGVNLSASFEAGAGPYAGLVPDTQGNFYGTTILGGAYKHGTVFKLDSSGRESTFYSFAGEADGSYPNGNLVFDEQGNLFGATAYGGSKCFYTLGCGLIFELTPSGKEKVIYRFSGGADGAFPAGGLVLDSQGNLYGTTFEGGYGEGVVFKLTVSGTETVLYAFSGGDGAYPNGGLLRDGEGNLFGTTSGGGDYDYQGTIFEVTPAGTESVLYNFTGNADGGGPEAGLVTDGNGNLFGTTAFGGSHYAYGTVFKFTP